MPKVSISRFGAEFEEYPYPPSLVYPKGKIQWHSVVEINSQAAPPEIRTRSGEILAVPATQAPELLRMASQAGVPDVLRVDVWGLVLEPFLDTPFTAQRRKYTSRLLMANGVSASERRRLRIALTPVMMAYNGTSGLWDCCHLGLFDVLDARLGCGVGALVPAAFHLGPSAFAKFYWRAMDLALRGGQIVSGQTAEDFLP